MIGTLMIGLREGLEAALVVSVLLAYVKKIGRPDAVKKIWAGIALAVVVSMSVGAILTYGAYGLTTQAQEAIGGSLSLVAVAMVTWMVFWMSEAAKTISTDLRERVDSALLIGSGWGVATIATISVGREGLETALFIWATTRGSDTSQLVGFLSAVSGILIAVVIGWLLYRGMIRINLTVFFRWSGVLLLVFAGGVLAYSLHDLMEAGIVPGPFMAAPAGAGSFLASWYGDASWAFQLSGSIAPDGFLGAILKGTIGFTPDMTKLELIAWFLYLVITLPLFLRRSYRAHAKSPAATAATA